MNLKSFELIMMKFLTDLEQLSEEFDELTDTDVRESLFVIVNYYFIWGEKLERSPISYGMFTLAGDQAVAQTVETFLSSVSNLKNIPVGITRLKLIQNPDITTPKGCQYDDYLGHTDELLLPEPLSEVFFEEGDYDD